MITITKSRFARRSLVLCGLAGAAVIWLMLSLVNLQLVSPRKTSGVSSGGTVPYSAARMRSQGRSDTAIRTQLLKEGYSSGEVRKIMQQLNS